jgi:hypothetical protein
MEDPVVKTQRLSIRRRSSVVARLNARRTERARDAFLTGFVSRADPDGALPKGDRRRRAQILLAQHMRALAVRRHSQGSLGQKNEKAAHYGGQLAREVPDDAGTPARRS